MAGIIGAIGNNGRGVSGLCWKSPIISVGFMDSEGRGYSSDAAEGIVYAVDQGAHVINASYGTTEPTDVERDAIQYAAAHDTLIVAAAGNDDQNSDKHPHYPAAYPDENVISVAASNEKDKLASFSNWGKKSVDLAAPGDSIASTANDGEYSYMSGTSMAAPLVAAAAAMVRKQGDGLPVRTHPQAAAQVRRRQEGVQGQGGQRRPAQRPPRSQGSGVGGGTRFASALSLLLVRVSPGTARVGCRPR